MQCAAFRPQVNGWCVCCSNEHGHAEARSIAFRALAGAWLTQWGWGTFYLVGTVEYLATSGLGVLCAADKSGHNEAFVDLSEGLLPPAPGLIARLCATILSPLMFRDATLQPLMSRCGVAGAVAAL